MIQCTNFSKIHSCVRVYTMLGRCNLKRSESTTIRTVPQCVGCSSHRMRVVEMLSVSSVSLRCEEFCQRLYPDPDPDPCLCLCLCPSPSLDPCLDPYLCPGLDLCLDPCLDLCLCHNLGLCHVPSPSLAPFHVPGYQKWRVASKQCLDLGCDLC